MFAHHRTPLVGFCRTLAAGRTRPATATATKVFSQLQLFQPTPTNFIKLSGCGVSVSGGRRNFATAPMLLSPDERSKAIATNLDSSWVDVDGERNAICRKYEFENFQQAWAFMTEIAKVADKMDHHPEWFNVYNRVEVTLTTHDCNGVSQKDITLASTMDACAKKILNPPDDSLLTFKPTCDLYDEYLDEARVPCLSFQSLGGKKQFCGLAVTVKCFEDNTKIKDLCENTNGKGKVLVVDGGGSRRCALLGDMVAKAAVENQWEGLVLNANVRDAEELRTLNIGVMALGTTPRKSVRRGEGQVDLHVRIGDVWCKPGDKVYADENGVLIVD